MKEKIKNLTVSQSNDYVVWSVNLDNVVKDTILDVEAGCIAYYIVNGNLKSVNTPGRWLINSKDELKTKSRLQLICAATDKTYDILCGVGNIPYKDNELNYDTFVGAYGECKIRICQPWTLYTAMGKSDIGLDELDEYVKLKLCELMTSRLAEVLQCYDYENIMTQQSKISEDLKKQFSKHLAEIGIQIDSFAMAGITFADDYKNARKETFENQNRRKFERENMRIKEHQQSKDTENLIAIINAAKDICITDALNKNSGSSNSENNKIHVKDSTHNDVQSSCNFCSRCGARLHNEAQFCQVCGKKI